MVTFASLSLASPAVLFMAGVTPSRTLWNRRDNEALFWLLTRASQDNETAGTTIFFKRNESSAWTSKVHYLPISRCGQGGHRRWGHPANLFSDHPTCQIKIQSTRPFCNSPNQFCSAVLYVVVDVFRFFGPVPFPAKKPRVWPPMPLSAFFSRKNALKMIDSR